MLFVKSNVKAIVFLWLISILICECTHNVNCQHSYLNVITSYSLNLLLYRIVN